MAIVKKITKTWTVFLLNRKNNGLPLNLFQPIFLIMEKYCRYIFTEILMKIKRRKEKIGEKTIIKKTTIILLIKISDFIINIRVFTTIFLIVLFLSKICLKNKTDLKTYFLKL